MIRDQVSSMRCLLEPKSIALVGASPRNHLVAPMLRTLRRFRYDGAVTLVHPGEESIEGFPCVASLADLESPPDSVALLMRTEGVVPALRDAAEFGVPAAVVFADGFGGEEGARLQREMAQVSRNAGMVVVGPNCEGVFNFVRGVGLFWGDVGEPAEEGAPPYVPGSVGLISHSGSVLDNLFANEHGVQLSHLISSGNETVTDAADFLAYLVDAPECQVICLFLETIRRPQEFRRQCDRAFAAGKPVIVLKSGRSEASAAAAAAHTGALAQPDRLVDAVLRRHRVLRVGSLEEMLATAVVLQAGRRPGGNRVGLVAYSGGLLDITADAVAAADLELPPFGQTTIDELMPLFDIPGKVLGRNPIDTFPSAVDPLTAFAKTFEAVSRDDCIDIVMLTTNWGAGISEFVDVAKTSDKPFVVVDAMPGVPSPQTVRDGLDAGVAIISGLDASMRAIEHLISYAEPEPAPVAATNGVLPGKAIMEQLRDRGGGTGMLALDVLRLAGLNVPLTVVARNVDDAVQAATEIGFPVVVKDADPHNAHKTESGGVFLHLRTRAAVTEAVDMLVAAGVKEVLVQREADIEHELILGLQTDQELGSFVVVGMGGIWAEILDDVAIRPIGLRSGEAQRMLESLRAYPVLRGARGRPSADLEGVIGALERLDAMGRHYGDWFQSVDVNPLVCGADGVFAVDALFTMVPDPNATSSTG